MTSGIKSSSLSGFLRLFEFENNRLSALRWKDGLIEKRRGRVDSGWRIIIRSSETPRGSLKQEAGSLPVHTAAVFQNPSVLIDPFADRPLRTWRVRILTRHKLMERRTASGFRLINFSSWTLMGSWEFVYWQANNARGAVLVSSFR